MALVFVVQHTLTFDTYQGSDIQWEIDILRSYEEGTTPSWFVDDEGTMVPPDPTALVGTAEPIEIEWLRDYDVYKPIQGSQAKLNLVVERAGQYPDFSQAGQFEYQLRLRYRDAANDLQDYWCGFITAVDGQESVATFPFEISFTATDGLGRLEDSVVDEPTSQDSTNLFNIVLDSLVETGLGLPVYVDSGIRNASGDALVDVTANGYSLYTNVEDRELLTRKEFIEGLLGAFNCKITQSNGIWYVFNSSTHGGLGITESKTWRVYETNDDGTEYELTTSVTEGLRYTVSDSGDPEMVPVGQDLVLNTRRPYGSIECRPDSFIELDYITNGCFDNGTEGFSVESGSIDQTLNRVANINHATCEFGVQNTRNRQVLNSTASETWFVSDPVDIDINAPLDISFDHVLTQINTSSVKNARLNYTIEVTLTSPVEVSDVINYQVMYGGSSGSQSVQPTQQVRTWYWNHGARRWDSYFDPPGNTKSATHNYHIKSEVLTRDDLNEWQSVSVQCHAPSQWRDLATGEPLGTGSGQLRVRFWYGTGERDNGRRNRQDGTGRMTQIVTNISVQNMYRNEITAPTYERVQDDYTTTLTYNPIYADNAPIAVYQRLDQEGYWLPGEASSAGRTLEEIVTQQKLNDFRLQFQYYEGNLLNLSPLPIGPKNKLLLNWSNFQSTTASSTTPTSLILNGGTFRVKSNIFDLAGYVPDQIGNQTSEFHTQNVNLVAAPFPGRSQQVFYFLGLRVDALDDNGLVLNVPDSMGRSPGDMGYVTTTGALIPEVENGILRLSGRVNEEIEVNIPLNVLSGYQAPLSNLSYFDGTNATGFFAGLSEDDAPSYVTDIRFTGTQLNPALTFKVTLPDESEYEELHVAGEVDIVDPDATSITVTIEEGSGSLAGVTIVQPQVVSRPAGTTVPVTYYFTAPTGMQWIQAQLGNIPQPVSDIDDVKGAGVYTAVGRLLQWSGSVLTQNMDVAPTFTFTFAATHVEAVSATGSSTVNVTINESLTNISTALPSMLTLVGPIGSTQTLIIPLVSAPFHEIDLDNVSGTTSDATLATYVAIDDPDVDQGATPTAYATFNISFTAMGGNVTLTPSATANRIGEPLFNYAIQINASGEGAANISIDEATETLSLPAGSTNTWSTLLRGNPGWNLSTSDLTLPADSGWTIADVGPDIVQLQRNASISATAPEAVADTLNITVGALTREPHTLNFYINSQTLSLGGTDMLYHPLGFDLDDTVPFSFTFDVESTDQYSYSATSLPSVTIGAITNTLTGATAIVTGLTAVVSHITGTQNARVTVQGSYPTTGVDLDIQLEVSGEPVYVGNYGLNPASTLLAYTGTDSDGITQLSVATIPVTTTPVQGRFSISGISGGTATISTNRNSVSVSAVRTAGTRNGQPFFTTPDTVFTLTHQDDPNLSVQVRVTRAIETQTVNGDANSVNGLTLDVLPSGSTAGTVQNRVYFILE